MKNFPKSMLEPVRKWLEEGDPIHRNSKPRTESLIAAVVRWAERIMRKVESVCSSNPRL
jgi:hypothetical protein